MIATKYAYFISDATSSPSGNIEIFLYQIFSDENGNQNQTLALYQPFKPDGEKTPQSSVEEAEKWLLEEHIALINYNNIPVEKLTENLMFRH